MSGEHWIGLDRLLFYTVSGVITLGGSFAIYRFGKNRLKKFHKPQLIYFKPRNKLMGFIK